MTATDQPTPRVGDTITTAEQLALLRDAVAQAMCAVEVRSKAASLEEVQVGISRWMRHRYEAERLIAELADYGVTVLYRPDAPHPAPVDGECCTCTRAFASDQIAVEHHDCPVHGDAVERAARAMQVENHPKPDPLNRDQREEQDEQTLPAYRALARVALAAARAGEVEPRATLLRVADEVQRSEWPGCSAEAHTVAEAIADMLREEAGRASTGEAVDREALARQAFLEAEDPALRASEARRWDEMDDDHPTRRRWAGVVESILARSAALAAARAGEAVDREALDRLANARDVRVYGDYGAGWRDGVHAGADFAARGDAAPTVNDREELDACHAADEAHGLNAGAAEAWRHTYLAALGIEVQL